MIHSVTKTFTVLHYTCRHFNSSHFNFAQLHFTTLVDTSLLPSSTSPSSTSLHLSTLHFFPFQLRSAPLHYTCRHFCSSHLNFTTSLQFTRPVDTSLLPFKLHPTTLPLSTLSFALTPLQFLAALNSNSV